ncbi:DUF1376 domain-containing protein [Acinetobacter sp. ANC 4641]|uniref:DUF1376 domain-containing protein n=1 Tax=Acinetobacter sp. ANC 4641 TaxID=2529847 RepID=UPI00103F2283|nr:DUF1376 domain-containing protein [Acinetobacter sp. ANC 4641]TCB13624.1 DUF1376 domain-containing protein [Acinetobacter sp. ANC 4641]
MNKDISIWMPLYIGDLQAKFARMTAEQIGATLLLMMDFWKNGVIPYELATVCSITKLPQQNKAKNLLNTLTALELFEIESEQIHSNFLTSLKSQALQNQQMKSDKAKNAAQARWNKSASNAQASNKQVQKNAQASLQNNLSITQAILELCPSSSSSSSSSSSEEKNEIFLENSKWI